MLENQKIRPAQVIGPLGEPLTLDSLPPASTTRWVVRRKAEVVAAVAGGLLTVDEACQRYTLSLEEFTSWQRAVDRSGMPGLPPPGHPVSLFYGRPGGGAGWYRSNHAKPTRLIPRPGRFSRVTPGLDRRLFIRNNRAASCVLMPEGASHRTGRHEQEELYG